MRPLRPLNSLISITEAQQLIDKKIQPLQETECISLLSLTNRVIAQDIVAKFNVPPFRRAAMDGYAVKAIDIKNATNTNPIRLHCIEKVLAGEVARQTPISGQCIEIATGSMLPNGTDTVIQVEETRFQGNQIEILKSMVLGTNVSAEGADIKQGDCVLKQNELLTPGRIGMLASLNIGEVMVYRKPKIAIIPTGREITSLGRQAEKGQIYDINSYTLHTMVSQFGGEPVLFPIIPDTFEELEHAILDAVKKADLVIIIGGSSVGERDINIDILAKHGTVLFHGIKVKPGKPTIAAILQNKPIINLPGFPTSCLTNGYVVILPILRKMAHLPHELRKISAPLATRVKSAVGRDLLLTVRLENGLVVSTFKESGAITSIARADGYVLVPYTVEFLEKGSLVDVILF